MSVLVLGVNHRSAPIEVLERLALDDASAAKLVHGLITSDVVREAVVLSTCNRTEVYAVAERFHGAHGALHDTLCDISGLGRAELDGHFYSFHDEAAVEHACAVAAGLESLVVGESEILGQVRHAVDVARAEGAVRSTLELLFRRAIAAGKRARTETGIARGTASISHAAVELAADHLGGLSGCRVAVVGAGTMGEQIAVALADADVDSITVVNRSRHRADSQRSGESLHPGEPGDIAPAVTLGEQKTEGLTEPHGRRLLPDRRPKRSWWRPSERSWWP
ncbi:MAG: glutamyl-tRNA reductase [Acidimicrobiia bacterium]|nr:glutamyl-tRNA reductase [Acidimicrobiia bacterium]